MTNDHEQSSPLSPNDRVKAHFQTWPRGRDKTECICGGSSDCAHWGIGCRRHTWQDPTDLHARY